MNLGKYYLPNDLKQIKIDNQNSINFFHRNISSLPYHLSELYTLFVSTEISFDIIGMTESRLTRNKNYLINITIPSYTIDNCPTDGVNGSVLHLIKT